MKNLTRLFLPLILAGATQMAGAAVYNNGDLLLVVRDGTHSDVEFDLGSVSNYVNQPAGSAIPISAFNSNLAAVKANFGGSLENVSYAVVAATGLGDRVPRVWLTDGSGSAPSVYLSPGAFSPLRGVISGAGSEAVAALGANSFPFIDATSDTASYDYIVSGGSLVDVDSVGGNAPFSVDAGGPNNNLPLYDVPFYEMVSSTESPIPAATLRGYFQLTGAGGTNLIFTPAAAAVPVVTAAVKNSSGTAGGAASLSETVYGATGYQWYFDGAAIAGATNSTLNFPNVTVTNAGDYTLVASSATGSVTNSATLAVQAAYSPADLILVFRDGVNPDVEFDLGSVSNYLGHASAFPAVQYDLAAVQANFGGSLANVSYSLVAATKQGDSLARVWLTDGGPAPGGYLTPSAFSDLRSVISGVGSEAGAADGGILPFVDSPSDTASFDYIVSGGSGVDVDSLGGNAPFSVEATGPATSLPFYEMVPSTETSLPAASLIGNFSLNNDGSITFTPAAVTPSFTAPVQNATGPIGGSASLSGAAYEAATYQWYFDGAAIAGATNSTLNLSNLGSASWGSYSLVATSAQGVSVTNSATLAESVPYSSSDLILVFRDGVNPDVEYDLGSVSNFLNTAAGTSIPVNYDISAVKANFGGSLAGVSYALVAATGEGNPSPSTWLSYGQWGSNPTGEILSPSAFSDLRAVISGVGSEAGSADHGDWPFVDSTSDTASYDYIVSGGSDSDVDSLGGNAPFTVEGVGPNSFVAFSQIAPGTPFQLVGVFSMAGDGSITFSNGVARPLITSQPASQTVVSSGTSTVLSVTAYGASGYQWLTNGVAIPGAISPTLTLATTAADSSIYSLLITNFAFASSITSAPVNLAIEDPLIVTAPAPVDLAVSGTANFSVTATGTSALSYQWKQNGTNLVGHTSSTLAVTVPTAKNGYTYSVVVSDAAGTNTTAPVALTVVTKAVTVGTVANKTVYAGQPVTFSTTVAGGVHPTYQWYAPTGTIAGATALSYANTAANFSDAGTYQVVVSDPTLSSPITKSATLAVNVPETISNPTATTTAKTGQFVTLKTTVANKTTLPYVDTYQWYNSNVAIPGATFATYTNPAVTANASYTVKVSYSYHAITGSLTSAAGVVTVNADTNKPSVAFVFPANKAMVTNNIQVVAGSLSLTGTAADNENVSQVFVSLNGGAYQAASVTNNPKATSVTWGLPVSPVVGTNTLAAYSVDLAGNLSTASTRSFFYAVPASVTVNIVGDGVVTATNLFDSATATLLEGSSQFFVGRNYMLTATAAHDNLFSNWVDGGTVFYTTNKISFTGNTNVALVANFVTNRFLAQAGTYYGLFSDTNENEGVSEDSAGWFTATVTPSDSKQSFSASIFVDGDSLSGITGTFDLTGKGTATKTVVRKNKAPLTLTLQMNFNDTIGGTVLNSENWTSTVSGDLSTYTATSPSPDAGTYNLLIPGFSDPTLGPVGYSYLTLKIAGGSAMASGSLADGVAISSIQAAGVSTNGDVPVYAKAYSYGFNTVSNGVVTSYAGSLLGWLNFSNSTPSGELFWIKTATATNTPYVGGFTNETDITGSLYTAPAAGPFITNLLTFAGGNLTANITDTVLVSTTGGHAVGVTNQLKSLTFTPSSGAVSGTFTNTATHTLTTFKGLYSPGTNYVGATDIGTNVIGGWFLGTSQGGSVFVQ